jgi:protocatechuate 3,4-dioxygenase, beta subunit
MTNKHLKEGVMKNTPGNLTRRSLLWRVAGTSLFVALAGLNLAALGCAHHASSSTPNADGNNKANVPSNIVMVSDKEPGEPLIVSGTVYAPDGKTPMAGANLYVYQTDTTGRYSTSGGENRGTRIHGLMRTDAGGRYEFRTIQPGAYPGRTNPAHIHVYVSGPGYPEYWTDDFLFEGDRFITEQERKKSNGLGSFAFILALTRGSDGVLRGARDFKLERCTNNCTGR